jgi:N-hydroxyarylamine O-acetyltransferase
MAADYESNLDLAAYFERIEYSGRARNDVTTLRLLHIAHATHIPFENIDVLLGVPIRLDPAGLQAKLVDARRGGYCFEQNSLFAAVLEQLGFDVHRLQARVRFGTERILPLTHMLLEVAAEGHQFLCDVGFGAWGLLEPKWMVEGENRQFAWNYRLLRDGAVWTLQAVINGDWQNLYSFTREPHPAVDYEPANYYVSHHPDSRFVQTLTAQLPLPDVRYLLNNRELFISRDGTTTTRTIADVAELMSLLKEHFLLDVPPGPWLPQSLAV